MEETENEFSRKFIYLLITITTIISTLLPHVSAVDDDDAAIMAKLAKSLSPTPTGWSGSDPCKWTSVSCDSSGRISSISLGGKSLSGELPSEFNQLSNLRSLSLQRNQLSGALPSLSNLTSLERVFLDNNNFSSIPNPFLLGLTSLQILSIGENPNLPPWTIPNSLFESTALVALLAKQCNIVGTIPDIFGKFRNLQNLSLSYNNLTGSLPASFGKSQIGSLWLNNQLMGLSGRLDVLGTMSQLQQVWLQSNQFSGPIPDLSNCTSINDLQLRDNQLTGVVPDSMISLPMLHNLSLQNNKFQGPMPSFPKNVQVTLGETNSFCNTSPGPCDPQVTTLLEVAGALGYPMTLAESWEGNNACKQWNFISCDLKGSVSAINFGKQNWVGTISPAIANLTALKNLLLNDNKLTGSIPDSLTSLAQLQLLDVSNNNLSGKIPPFASYVMLKTSGNPLLGTDLPSVPNNTSPGGTSSTGTNSPSGGATTTESSISPWGIVGTIVIAVILIVALFLVIYKCYMKKRSGRFKWVSGSQSWKDKEKKDAGAKVTSYDALASESSGQSRDPNSDIHVYDGGNVAIPIEVLREVTNNFSEDNILGKGGFGVVYRGQLHDGTEIAVKRMESTSMNNKGLNEFKAEIEVLTKVRHRNLVALHGFCVDGNERLVVYEYMPQGTLGQHLYHFDEMGFHPLTWKERVTIALDNAPEGQYSVETRLAGTFGYLAPEYAATGRVTTKIDVFSYGVVLMEMITGRGALDETFPEDRIHLVPWFRRILVNRDNIRQSIDPSLDPDTETLESIFKVSELARHCTAREPSQRPDMGHAVNVLSPLVEQWKPTSDEEEDGFGINLRMSLPQALQRWQASEGSTMNDLNTYSDASTTCDTAAFWG
ncbi:unnamed protein product [Ilex paraguariensis]|uniref:Protein kinase domain-containing protein n=1 Tax=Ilex paraguariensis TaxID=185542 RepID=A0ABC8RFR4_9AQUA